MLSGKLFNRFQLCICIDIYRDTMSDESFPKHRRLRTKTEFANAYSGEDYASDNVLVIRGVLNDFGFARLGISVSKKFGNACVRNRWKRLMREAFRHSYKEIDFGIDLVVRPRKGAEPDYEAIKKSMPVLAGKLRRRLLKRIQKPGN